MGFLLSSSAEMQQLGFRHIDHYFSDLNGSFARGGRGVLPYMGYIGMCSGIGYGFWRFSVPKQGILFAYVGVRVRV